MDYFECIIEIFVTMSTGNKRPQHVQAPLFVMEQDVAILNGERTDTNASRSVSLLRSFKIISLTGMVLTGLTCLAFDLNGSVEIGGDGLERAGVKMGQVRRLQTAEKGVERVAIVALVSNMEKDMVELCTALKTLALLHGDELESPKSPVLVFNEGDLFPEQQVHLRSCTDRFIDFPIVNFNEFPPGFDPVEEEKKRTTFHSKPGRSTWGYHQMISFWNTRIWKHPAIEPFDIVMRIDSDSCFTEESSFLPFLASDGFVYHSNFVGAEYPAVFVEGLYDYTVDYMRREGIVPANPEMWAIVENVKNVLGTLPLFQTNFEVSRKSFMQREDVAKWHESLTEMEPFGVYRRRWGDAVIRFLTSAMFAEPGSVQLDETRGYFHNKGCQRDDFDEIVSTSVLKNYAKYQLGEPSEAAT